MVQPWGSSGTGSTRSSTTSSERTEDDLCDDGADLPGGGGETVRGGTVTGWEAFTRNNEGGRVGTEVEEKLGKDVKSEERVAGELVVSETDNDEKNGEECETHDLDGLSAESVDGGDGDPVTWNGTGANEDEVTNGGSVEDFIHITAARIADSTENDGVVETKTVVGDIEEEP